MEKILAILENHFDQVWRRCFKRDFENDGNTYISYEKIEKMYIDRCIEIAQKHPEFKFQIETAVVVDTYIKNNPEKKDILRELYKKRQLRVCDSGYYITDSNMISIESFITNFLLSDRFFKELFGEISPVVTRRDAFGNSAQLPQVFKSLHKKSVIGISYSTAKGDVWQGIDKSAVCVKNPPFAGGAGGWMKFAPCEKCKGKGCSACGGTGVNREKAKKDWWNLTVYDDRTKADGVGSLVIGCEELIPEEKLVNDVNELKEKYPVEFAFNEDYLPYIENINDKIARGDLGGLSLHTSCQLNFNNTGCYVSRIRTKQRLIQAENEVFDLDVLNALRYLATAKNSDMSEIYKQYLFGAFHDSVAGTMIDAGYEEIMDNYDDLEAKTAALRKELTKAEKSEEGKIYYFNSLPIVRTARVKIPVSAGERMEIDGAKLICENGAEAVLLLERMQPFEVREVYIKREKTESFGEEAAIAGENGGQAFKGAVLNGADEGTIFEKGGKRTVENKRYRLTVSNNGIEEIYDKKLSKTVCCAGDGEFLPFEHVLETDIGSPWTTLENYFAKTGLAKYTRLVDIAEEKDCTWVEFLTEIPNVLCGESNENSVAWRVELIDGLDEILYFSDVEWHNFNRRLKVAFPLPFAGEAKYTAPGAVIPCEKYEPYFSWLGATGDYPAYRFAAVTGKNCGAAVFNAGTPCFKIEKNSGNDTMFVSLLRSPTVPTYLHEPKSYTMKAWDGMRDNGKHSFSLAFCSYEKFDAFTLSNAADAFAHPVLRLENKPYLAKLPSVKLGKARITRIKTAADGDGIIVRLTDDGGFGGVTEMKLPENIGAAMLCDMAENKEKSLDVAGGKLTLSFRPYEIKTLKLKKV